MITQRRHLDAYRTAEVVDEPMGRSVLLIQLMKKIGSKILFGGLARSSFGAESSDSWATSGGEIVIADTGDST